jgi:hypothetical protein
MKIYEMLSLMLLIFYFYIQSKSNVSTIVVSTIVETEPSITNTDFVLPKTAFLSKKKQRKINKYGKMYGVRASNIDVVEPADLASLSKNKRNQIRKYGVKYDVRTSTSKTPPVINLDFVEAPTNIDLIAGRAAQEDSEEALATEGNWKSYFYNLRYSKSFYKK